MRHTCYNRITVWPPNCYEVRQGARGKTPASLRGAAMLGPTRSSRLPERHPTPHRLPIPVTGRVGPRWPGLRPRRVLHDLRAGPTRRRREPPIIRQRQRLPRCYGYDTVLWCPPGVVLVDARELARGPLGAVLFDFGGTLDADGLRWSVRFYAAYARNGGRLDFGTFDPLFGLSDRRLETLPGIRGLGLRNMIEAQVAILRNLLPDESAMDAHEITEQVHNDVVRTIARNRPILASLRDRYRLAVVSNFTGNLSVCLEELALADMFDVITDSAVLGAAKPDARPFVATLAALDVSPSQAWMVGDNLQADIRPAQKLGLRAVWLAPSEQPDPVDSPPTARISTLAELPAVLAAAPDAIRTGRRPCTA
jgi:HAD superfamily hydrolase (TIGR01509 family)